MSEVNERITIGGTEYPVRTLTPKECLTALFPPSTVLFTCLGEGNSTMVTVGAVSLAGLLAALSVAKASRTREADDEATTGEYRKGAVSTICAGILLDTLRTCLAASTNTSTSALSAALVSLGIQQLYLVPAPNAADAEPSEYKYTVERVI